MENNNTEEGAADGGDLTAWEYLTKMYDNNEMLDDDFHMDADVSTSSMRSFTHYEDNIESSNSIVNVSLKRDWSVLQQERFSSPTNYNSNEVTTTRVSDLIRFQQQGGFESIHKPESIDQQIYPVTNRLEHSTEPYAWASTQQDVESTSSWKRVTSLKPYYQGETGTTENELEDHLQLHPNKWTRVSGNFDLNQTSKTNEVTAQLTSSICQDGFISSENSLSNLITQADRDNSIIELHVKSVLNKTVVSQTSAIINPQDQALLISERIPPYLQYNDNSLLLKPLTPYNYFYRDERDNIVPQITHENDPLPPPILDFSNEKMDRLLHQRWFIDPLKAKRIHRKTHGKISFQALSKIISERWRKLPKRGRDFYRTVARTDEMFYHQHLMRIMKTEGNHEVNSVPVSDVNQSFKSDDDLQKSDYKLT